MEKEGKLLLYEVTAQKMVEPHRLHYIIAKSGADASRILNKYFEKYNVGDIYDRMYYNVKLLTTTDRHAYEDFGCMLHIEDESK